MGFCVLFFSFLIDLLNHWDQSHKSDDEPVPRTTPADSSRSTGCSSDGAKTSPPGLKQDLKEQPMEKGMGVFDTKPKAWLL